MQQLTGLKQLKESLKATREANNGYIIGLQDKLLFSRAEYSDLNLLCQNAGATICKQWLVNIRWALEDKGYIYGWHGDYVICAWVHDEVQVAIKHRRIGAILIDQLAKVQQDLNLKCALTGEYKIGRNWSETH